MNCQKEIDSASTEETMIQTCVNINTTHVYESACMWVLLYNTWEKEVTLLKIFTRQSSREKFTMINSVDRLVSSWIYFKFISTNRARLIGLIGNRNLRFIVLQILRIIIWTWSWFWQSVSSNFERLYLRPTFVRLFGRWSPK